MNKENAEKVKVQLMKEVSDMIQRECFHLVEIKEKVKYRLRVARENLGIREQQIVGIEKRTAENLEKQKTSKPEEWSELSRIRADLAKDLAEVSAELDMLKKHVLPAIEKELLEVQELLRVKVLEFMYVRMEVHNEEVYSMIHNDIEPRISGWRDAVDAISSEYRFATGQQTVLRDTAIYSPLVLKACGDGADDHKLRVKALNIENSAEQPVDAPKPTKQK